MKLTAKPIIPGEPFLIIRTEPNAVLKYQVNTTGCSKPEGIIVNSQVAPIGVAVREESETTGIAVSLVR